jgi:hypothetical protein
MDTDRQPLGKCVYAFVDRARQGRVDLYGTAKRGCQPDSDRCVRMPWVGSSEAAYQRLEPQSNIRNHVPSIVDTHVDRDADV